jgi:ABC-type transport system involved in multi-copper enzyme maturation permease subunit
MWWLMLLGVVGFTAISLAFNLYFSNAVLNGDVSAQEAGLGNDARGIASYVYTSGQYFGTLFVMLLGALVVTNEYHHQTATPTFLATPRRLRVIGSKLVAAVAMGLAFGLVTVLIAVPVGALFLSSKGVGTQLDQSTVLASLGLNLLAYAIWAIFGIGLGTLLRNQIAALVVCLVLKLVAESVVTLVLSLLSNGLHQDWIMNLAWALPSQASSIMTSAVKLPDQPYWYAGAAILLAYGVVAGGLGSLLMRKRDIT